MVGEDHNEVNSFYEKLKKLNESSGLTLVFNFRETILDLYIFYKEVTRRGGFNQVTIDRKWDEVASSLDIKSNDSMLLNQLQKVYQNLLYPYEQTQHYRTPAKTNKISGYSKDKGKRDENVLPHSVVSPDELDRSAKKRDENVLPHSVVSPDELDRTTKKRKHTANTQQQESTGPETPEQKKSKKKQPKGKELKKEYDGLVRPRNSYQIFFKAECDRLKSTLSDKSNFVNLRTMVTDKWKRLSETDKQPYIEASKADKVRYLQEVVNFKLQQEKQENDAKTATTSSPNCNMLKFCTSSSEIERDYHVKFDPDTGDLVPPPPFEPLIIESTEEIMKRANNDSTDPICSMNYYEYDFNDLPEPSV